MLQHGVQDPSDMKQLELHAAKEHIRTSPQDLRGNGILEIFDAVAMSSTPINGGLNASLSARQSAYSYRAQNRGSSAARNIVSLRPRLSELRISHATGRCHSLLRVRRVNEGFC